MARKKNNSENIGKKEETVRKRKWEKQYELFQHLKRNPNIEWASQKVGVHRSTVYRWMEESEDFKKMLGYSLKEGTSVMNDIMESLLIQAAKNYKVGAITFWLRNRHPAYLHIRLQERLMEIFKDSITHDLTQEQLAVMERAFKAWSIPFPEKLPTDES